jgi:hypothetical protein
VAGIQLSSEASPDAINQAILKLAEGKKEAESKLSTKDAELITVKKSLSDKEGEIKAMKDAQATELSKAREAKIAKLKEQAVTEVKLSKAEIEEKDPAKQVLFVKLLSLDDLSLAEQGLSTLAKKVEAKGTATSGKELSAEESLIEAAKALQADAVKAGKSLSNADAYEKAKATARKAAEGGK